MTRIISISKVKILHESFINGILSKRHLAKTLNISRNTVKKHLYKMKLFYDKFPDETSNIKKYIAFFQSNRKSPERYPVLENQFPAVFDSIINSNSNLISEWKRFKVKFPDGYGQTQFRLYFYRWLKDNNLSIEQKKYKINLNSQNDLQTFKKWRLSSDRRKWEKAVVILDLSKGKTISEIESKIERSRRKIKSWIRLYEGKGVEGLLKPRRRINKSLIQYIETKKKNLIKLIHETPKNFGINRSSWSLKSLKDAYNKKYNVSISTTMISEYIKSQGYAFRKAKKVLTSPDPNYREKLQKITTILSNLSVKEKFFSVDEFGPFAIKIQGGRSIVKKDEANTYPQWQKSKGCLICIAGLELSQNQITHFYSSKKNTDEMIKLLKMLLVKYKDDEKIYFSWDAVSWHASKKLQNKISEVNNIEYRTINHTPIVELAPLPASAQFLNVIESVFSGMAKAIIHNSNYQTVEDCKSAIDIYFNDRNDFFRKYPKRAGKKIWGKESNKPVFDETQNFKDSRWR